MLISLEQVKTGRYRHYKGNCYEVLGVTHNTETHEDFVLYRALEGDQTLLSRPKQMFFETVVLNGKKTPRFKHIESYEVHITAGINSLCSKR